MNENYHLNLFFDSLSWGLLFKKLTYLADYQVIGEHIALDIDSIYLNCYLPYCCKNDIAALLKFDISIHLAHLADKIDSRFYYFKYSVQPNGWLSVGSSAFSIGNKFGNNENTRVLPDGSQNALHATGIR